MAAALVALLATLLVWIFAAGERDQRSASARNELVPATIGADAAELALESRADAAAELDAPTAATRTAVETPAPAAGGDTAAGLEPGVVRTFRAHVVDEDGAPIPGARLSVELDDVEHTATGGADGVVTVSLPPDTPRRNGWFNPTVTAEARTSQRFGVRGNFEGEHFLGEVVLLPAGAVVGRVLDERGAPLRASVLGCDAPEGWTALERERFETLGEGLRSRRHGWTGTDGSFRLESVESGEVVVVASRAGMLRAMSAPFELAVGESHDVGALVLRAPPPENRIAGRVLDEHGAPAPALLVELWNPGVKRNVQPEAVSVRSAEDGSFAFSVPSTATYHVVLFDQELREEVARVETVAAGTDDVVLRVPRERWLEIGVLNAAGEKLEDAWITTADAEGFGMRHRAEHAETGIWRLQVPGRPFQFWVHAPEFETEWSGIFADRELVPDRFDFVLRESSSARLRGTITDGGAPVARAAVRGYRAVERPSRLVTGFATRLVDRPTVSSGATGEDGEYELTFDQEAVVHLLVLVDGKFVHEYGPVQLDPSREGQRLDLALPPRGSIHGRVLVAEGRDPAGLLVGASRGDGDLRTMKLGPEATYRFSDLAAGDWQVRIVTENSHLLDDRRTIGAHEEAEVDVHLDPGAGVQYDLDLRHEVFHRVNGQLRFAPDGPSEWWYWIDRQRGELDSDGRFTVDTFGAGALGLSLWAEVSPSVRMSVRDSLTLVPGDNDWIVDRPTAELELSGVPAFTRDEARNHEPELLRLERDAEERLRVIVSVQQHGGGPLRLRGLPEGTWSVSVRFEEDGSPGSSWKTVLEGLELGAGAHVTAELP